MSNSKYLIHISFNLLIFSMLVVSIIIINDAWATIPPTRAFMMINNTNGNVTASSSSGWVEFKEGTGITIIPSFSTNEVTFSASGSGLSETYCNNGDFFYAYNVTSNTLFCDTAPTGSGENNTGTNVGTGVQIFKDKLGAALRFRTLLNDTNISITQLTDEVSFSLNTLSKSIISSSGTWGWNEVSKIGSSIHDLADVASSCATDQILRFNSTNFWDCYTLTTSSLKVNTQSATNGVFITGIDNSTGVITTQTFKITSKTCSANQFVSDVNNSTGDVTCSTPTGSTDTNTAQIVSAGGTSLFKARNNATENSIKGLTTTRGITLTANTNDVQIDTNFKVNTKSSATRQFLTSFNNATTSGEFGTVTFGVNNPATTCGGTDKISAISFNNATGVWTITCSTDSTGGTSREETVSHWETDKTWANIGTAYVDVYLTANSNGEGLRIDTAGKTTATLNIMWTKIGAGTQKCRMVDIASAANVLIEATNLSSGQNTNATQNIPAGLANTIKTYKPQCLSTTGTDDPVWLSGQILLK